MGNKRIVCLIVYLLFLFSCGKSNVPLEGNNSSKMNEFISLKVGESYWNDGREVFKYCGMISDNIFAISSCEYRSSVNLYYPVTIKNIDSCRIPITVYQISYNYIIIGINQQ